MQRFMAQRQSQSKSSSVYRDYFSLVAAAHNKTITEKKSAFFFFQERSEPLEILRGKQVGICPPFSEVLIPKWSTFLVFFSGLTISNPRSATSGTGVKAKGWNKSFPFSVIKSTLTKSNSRLLFSSGRVYLHRAGSQLCSSVRKFCRDSREGSGQDERSRRAPLSLFFT